MMRRMVHLVVGVLWAAALAGPSVGQCEVRLNEVLADPDRDWDGDGLVSSRDDEWVEIVATSGETLDGYFLGDEVGGFVYGFDGSLTSGAVRVVFGGDAVAWESAHGESATGLRLGNTGDTVTLWYVDGPDTTLVDSYTYADHEADNDRSSGRLPDGAADWVLFDALFPYTGSATPPGTGFLPTPGAANGSGESSPVSVTTWGRIKALHTAP